jgi:hypothetical protein
MNIRDKLIHFQHLIEQSRQVKEEVKATAREIGKFLGPGSFQYSPTHTVSVRRIEDSDNYTIDFYPIKPLPEKAKEEEAVEGLVWTVVADVNNTVRKYIRVGPDMTYHWVNNPKYASTYATHSAAVKAMKIVCPKERVLYCPTQTTELI